MFISLRRAENPRKFAASYPPRQQERTEILRISSRNGLAQDAAVDEDLLFLAEQGRQLPRSVLAERPRNRPKRWARPVRLPQAPTVAPKPRRRIADRSRARVAWCPTHPNHRGHGCDRGDDDVRNARSWRSKSTRANGRGCNRGHRDDAPPLHSHHAHDANSSPATSAGRARQSQGMW